MENVGTLELLLVAVAIVALRWFFYHLQIRSTTRCLKKFERHLTKPDFEEIIQMRPEVNKLFRQANINPKPALYAESIGYGHVATGTVTADDNLGVLRQDIVQFNLASFHEAIGSFTTSRNESLNPFYWLLLIANHPRKILGYVGLNEHGSVAKLLHTVAILIEITLGTLLIIDRQSNLVDQRLSHETELSTSSTHTPTAEFRNTLQPNETQAVDTE